MNDLLDRVDWDAVRTWGAEHVWRIALVMVLAAVAIMFVNRLVPRVARTASVVRHGSDDPDAERRALTIAAALTRTFGFVVALIAALMILDELGLNLTPLIAGVSVGSVALGLAAQSLVKDYLKGFVILSERYYAVGDRVTIAGVTGIVEDVSLRRTLLRGGDGTLHFVSNGDVGVASRHAETPAATVLHLTVPYDADPAQVTRIVTDTVIAFVADEAWRGAVEGAPAVGVFESFDDLGGSLPVSLHVRADVRWVVVSELRRRIHDALAAAGITIAHHES